MEGKAQQPRYSSSPQTNYVAMRGNEVPISKTVPPSKRHSDYDVSLLRQSANQLLTNPSLQSPRSDAVGTPVKNRLFDQEFSYSRLSTDYKAKELPSYRNSLEELRFPVVKLETQSLKSASQHYRNSSLPYDLLKQPVIRVEPDPLPSTDFAFSRKPRAVDFSPYSFRDYQELKPDKYITLGGIGPARVGTKEWEDQKAKQQKMKAYAERVKGSLLSAKYSQV